MSSVVSNKQLVWALSVATALLMLLAGNVTALSVELTPGSGAVLIEQIDFRNAPNSATAELTVFRSAANALLNPPQCSSGACGYVNVSDAAGAWLVRNLPVLSSQVTEKPSITARFNLGVPDGVDVPLISLFVDYSTTPVVFFPGGPPKTYPVGSVDYAAGGVDVPLIGYTLAPDLSRVIFTPIGEVFHFGKKGYPNVQAARNQCVPAALANSFDFLRITQGLPVPHPNIPGLRNDVVPGPVTLVGEFEKCVDRFVVDRTVGDGAWPLDGKLCYIAKFGLKNKLIVKHRGDAGPDGAGETGGVPSVLFDGTKNFTRHGVTSFGQGAFVTHAWMLNELRKCEDLEIVIDWEHLGGIDGRHMVMVTGAGTILGMPYITHVSDQIQTDADPTDTLGTDKVQFDWLLAAGPFAPRPELTPSMAIIDQAMSESKVRVKQVYPGRSRLDGLAGAAVTRFMGYLGSGNEDLITSVPGIFHLTPGPNWANFVQAANLEEPVPYTIKNVVLTKDTPPVVQCSEVFAPKRVVQHGTRNIRLWWPTMYEIPGTTWTLAILYATPTAVQLPGEDSPRFVHSDVWTFSVEADIRSIRDILDIFHELPFGQDEVPLISNEELYVSLKEKLHEAETDVALGDTIGAGLILGDIELLIANACISSSPASPFVGGPHTGIAQTSENPACCKLLADIEYIGRNLGVFVSSK